MPRERRGCADGHVETEADFFGTQIFSQISQLALASIGNEASPVGDALLKRELDVAPEPETVALRPSGDAGLESSAWVNRRFIGIRLTVN